VSERYTPDYTPAEMEQAVSLLMQALAPVAAQHGMNAAELMDATAEDLLAAQVTAYLITIQKNTPAGRVHSDAAVIMLGLLRRTPGREALAEQMISRIYRTIRAEHGLPVPD
jgi:hypothetical protein